MRWVVYTLLAANLTLLTWNLYGRGAVGEAAPAVPALPEAPGEAGELPLLSEIGKDALRTRAGASAPASPAAPPGPVTAATATSTPTVPDIDPAVMAGGESQALAPPPQAAVPPPPARACLTLGPLAEDAPLEPITAWLRERGAEVDVRTDERREVALYWVYFPPRASREAAVEEVVRMRDAGLDDVIVVPKGDMANAISLGVFSRTDTRDRRVKDLEARGYEPLVSPRYRTKVATWIDVSAEQGALEPGAVAGRWPEIQATTRPCPAEQIAVGAAASYNSEPGTQSAARRFHFSGADARAR